LGCFLVVASFSCAATARFFTVLHVDVWHKLVISRVFQRSLVDEAWVVWVEAEVHIGPADDFGVVAHFAITTFATECDKVMVTHC
jgi:hypothetical protein